MNTPEMNAAKSMLERHGRWHEEHDASTEVPPEMVAEMRATTRAAYASAPDLHTKGEAWLMGCGPNPYKEDT